MIQRYSTDTRCIRHCILLSLQSHVPRIAACDCHGCTSSSACRQQLHRAFSSGDGRLEVVQPTLSGRFREISRFETLGGVVNLCIRYLYDVSVMPSCLLTFWQASRINIESTDTLKWAGACQSRLSSGKLVGLDVGSKSAERAVANAQRSRNMLTKYNIIQLYSFN